jgi:carbonic anhydrase/acetyltransferase-like protein (isoleucine patch superfamily)
MIWKLLKVSVGAEIHHDLKIGEYSVTAHQTPILGRAEIGSESFIGLESKISPNCKIGSLVSVSMCSVVLDNLSDGCKAWG